MNKTINIILIMLIYFISFGKMFSQEKGMDTVYVTAEKFTPEREMRMEARKDIANGNVYLKIYGLVVLSVDKNQLDSLTHKYGFETKLGGCVIPFGAEAYNDEVMLYLNKRNGLGWWEKYSKEYKLLKRIIKPMPKKPD